ncbi:MAG: hypothetical protein V4629_10580 [Pseudomonadota bacterium]
MERVGLSFRGARRSQDELRQSLLSNDSASYGETQEVMSPRINLQALSLANPGNTSSLLLEAEVAPSIEETAITLVAQLVGKFSSAPKKIFAFQNLDSELLVAQLSNYLEAHSVPNLNDISIQSKKIFSSEKIHLFFEDFNYIREIDKEGNISEGFHELVSELNKYCLVNGKTNFHGTIQEGKFCYNTAFNCITLKEGKTIFPNGMVRVCNARPEAISNHSAFAGWYSEEVINLLNQVKLLISQGLKSLDKDEVLCYLSRFEALNGDINIARYLANSIKELHKKKFTLATFDAYCSENINNATTKNSDDNVELHLAALKKAQNGDIEAAKNQILSIADINQKSIANILVSEYQANENKFDAAKETANSINIPIYKFLAFKNIANAQALAGDLVGAKITLHSLEDSSLDFCVSSAIFKIDVKFGNLTRVKNIVNTYKDLTKKSIALIDIAYALVEKE